MDNLYYTNASGDSNWETLTNWNTAADGSGDNPTNIPWTYDGSGGAWYGDADLIDATGGNGISINSSIDPNGVVTGTCDIVSINNNSIIDGGTFSGDNFTNNYVIYGGTFPCGNACDCGFQDYDSCGICGGDCSIACLYGICGCSDDYGCGCNSDGSSIAPIDNCHNCDGSCGGVNGCSDCGAGCGSDYDDCGNCNFYGEGCRSGCDNCGNCNGGYGGCTDGSACNYDHCASYDDGSCTYPIDNCHNCAGNCICDLDCQRNCGGDALLDNKNRCYSFTTGYGSPTTDQNGISCAGASADHFGYCYGDATLDCSGINYYSPTNEDNGQYTADSSNPLIQTITPSLSSNAVYTLQASNDSAYGVNKGGTFVSNSGLRFDDTHGLYIPNGTLPASVLDSFTVTAWVKGTGDLSGTILFLQPIYNIPHPGGLKAYIDSSNHLVFSYNSGPFPLRTNATVSSVNLADNNWHFCTFKFFYSVGSQLDLDIININFAAKVDNSAWSTNQTLYSYGNSIPHHTGFYNQDILLGNLFNTNKSPVTFSSFGLWNTTLSDTAITAIKNNSNTLDLSNLVTAINSNNLSSNIVGYWNFLDNSHIRNYTPRCNHNSTDCNGGCCGSVVLDCAGVCGGTGYSGCNNSSACNYDPNASCDDGSCTGQRGCTTYGACNYDSGATCDDGSCSWGCTDSGARNYHSYCDNCWYTDCADNTACNYDYNSFGTSECSFPSDNCHNCDGSCGGVNGCVPDCLQNCGGSAYAGCTANSSACNYDPNASCDDGSCSGYAGCTNSSACNYDPNASCDDGSCSGYYGCTNSSACNYDPNASCDDGSCSGYYGCTAYGSACNYDPNATCDDGSCTGQRGCTNSSACNYDPNATCDDGSCSGYYGCTAYGSACNYDLNATCDDGSCYDYSDSCHDSCGNCTCSDCGNGCGTETDNCGNCVTIGGGCYQSCYYGICGCSDDYGCGCNSDGSSIAPIDNCHNCDGSCGGVNGCSDLNCGCGNPAPDCNGDCGGTHVTDACGNCVPTAAVLPLQSQVLNGVVFGCGENQTGTLKNVPGFNIGSLLRLPINI